MKAVLMVAYHYAPEASSSGVLRTLKFSRYLPSYGWRPHILTLRESAYAVRDEGLRAQVPEEAVVHRTRGFDITRLAVRGRYPAGLAVPDRFVSWLPFGVARGVRVVRSARVRALYSTSPQPTAHLIAATLRGLTGIPWVADFRDPWIDEATPFRPGSLRWAVESRLERAVIGRADRITVTTPLFRQELLRRHPTIRPEKVVAVFNGYDETDFEGVKASPRTDYFEILHAGLVTPEYRDPRPVLEAVASGIRDKLLPRDDIRLVFLGGGHYLEIGAFTHLVRKLNLSEVVEVVGRVPYHEALCRMVQASVLLLLQASDDTRSLIPAKAFEYLRARRPILAVTRDGATAQLIRNTRSGVVAPPENVDGVRTALRDLYARRALPEVPIERAPDISQYERRVLTGELARLLDQLA